MTFVICILLMPISAFAADYESRPVSFWDSFIYKGLAKDYDVPFIDGIATAIGDLASSDVCGGGSPDKLHHGSIVQEGSRGGTDKNGNLYFDCICQYCGDHFRDYASDLSAAYDTYVETLPASGYNSSGRLIWDSWGAFTGKGTCYANGWKSFSSLPYMKTDSGYDRSYRYSVSSSGNCISGHFVNSSGLYTHRRTALLRFPLPASSCPSPLRRK